MKCSTRRRHASRRRRRSRRLRTRDTLLFRAVPWRHCGRRRRRLPAEAAISHSTTGRSRTKSATMGAQAPTPEANGGLVERAWTCVGTPRRNGRGRFGRRDPLPSARAPARRARRKNGRRTGLARDQGPSGGRRSCSSSSAIRRSAASLLARSACVSRSAASLLARSARVSRRTSSVRIPAASSIRTASS